MPLIVAVPAECPRENVSCKSVEFDNIKVFYHPTYLDLSMMDMWNFYIGRPGTSASQCIDWVKEGIRVQICCPTGEWAGTTALVVTSGALVRITYNFRNGHHTRELVFPQKDPSVSTIYLEPM
jgi:hypothetical protein